MTSTIPNICNTTSFMRAAIKHLLEYRAGKAQDPHSMNCRELVNLHVPDVHMVSVASFYECEDWKHAFVTEYDRLCSEMNFKRLLKSTI